MEINMKVKALLYCCKNGKKLVKGLEDYFLEIHSDNYYWKKGMSSPMGLNGKIVCECEVETEEFSYMNFECLTNKYVGILKHSCLTDMQMYHYLRGESGYLLHLTNVKVFDNPRELSDYLRFDGIYNNINNWKPIQKAPQNMRYAYEYKSEMGLSGTLNRTLNKRILISVNPQWLCKILNGEKDIEVRRKVLKGMVD